MTKNPLINALCASAYIIAVVTVMTLATQSLRNKPDTFFAPIMFLSILTLSVAVMAYLFFYQPIQLYIEDKKKQAVDLFLQTVLVFAGITSLILVLVMFRVFA